MSGEDPMVDDWRDLLSALLDGELGPEEDERVRALVAASPEAQEELAALAQVRTLVRDLPPVDPPFGFYERMLRPRRTHRFPGAKVAGAVAAAAAAIVLVVGITPATDRIAPPVAAYAQRHQEMEPIVAEPASATEPLPTGAADDDFEAMPDEHLDALGAPAELTGYRRMSGYQDDDGALHLLYSDGAVVVSVYEQVGELAWDRLPEGEMVQVGELRAWTMVGSRDEVMVFERGLAVYTIVASRAVDAHDEMVEMADELPRAEDPSLFDRFRGGCRSIVDQFGMGPTDDDS